MTSCVYETSLCKNEIHNRSFLGEYTMNTEEGIASLNISQREGQYVLSYKEDNETEEYAIKFCSIKSKSYLEVQLNSFILFEIEELKGGDLSLTDLTFNREKLKKAGIINSEGGLSGLFKTYSNTSKDYNEMIEAIETSNKEEDKKVLLKL